MKVRHHQNRQNHYRHYHLRHHKQKVFQRRPDNLSLQMMKIRQHFQQLRQLPLPHQHRPYKIQTMLNMIVEQQ
jgi:hypothetical protein